MEIRRAKRADIGAVCRVFASAYHSTPQWEWMIPDERVRYKALVRIGRPTAIHARVHGKLDVAVDESGAIIGASAWLPSNRASIPNWRIAVSVLRLTLLIGPRIRLFWGRTKTLAAAVALAHPRMPHWYLSGIMVDPAAQNQGVAAALLAAAPGGPLYLECTATLVPFYERIGFVVTRPIIMVGMPTQFGMWRS